jgi:hypothetical protein
MEQVYIYKTRFRDCGEHVYVVTDRPLTETAETAFGVREGPRVVAANDLLLRPIEWDGLMKAGFTLATPYRA